MANAKEGNVWYIDTDNTVIPGPVEIESIKYIGAASGTANLKSENDSGALLWQESGTANLFDAGVCIRTNKDVHVNLTNSAVVYIYLET